MVCGISAYLSKKLNVPIAMHEADYDLTKDNRAEPMSAHTLLGKVILKLSQKSFEVDKIDQFEASIFLSDGGSLSGCGIDGTIVELPGHTKGSIGIIVGETDVIVGDALMNMIHPVKSPLFGDKAIMEKSVAKISSLGDEEGLLDISAFLRWWDQENENALLAYDAHVQGRWGAKTRTVAVLITQNNEGQYFCTYIISKSNWSPCIRKVGQMGRSRSGHQYSCNTE